MTYDLLSGFTGRAQSARTRMRRSAVAERLPFGCRFALAWRRRMRQPGLLWFFPGHHVSPQRIDVLGLEQVAPRRHAVLAFRHRIDEAAFLVGRKLTQKSRFVNSVTKGKNGM